MPKRRESASQSSDRMYLESAASAQLPCNQSQAMTSLDSHPGAYSSSGESGIRA
jgi:hypothetical protein